MPAAEARPRPRNKRGQGARLRDDIVQAAATLLEQSGAEDALTLRAVARAAGITAPAIYAHFTDVHEIKLAVVRATFSTLAGALRPAVAGQDQPVPALLAMGRAYLDFAAEHPALYRVLFERHRAATVEPGTADLDVVTMIGADAYGVLVGAVQACVDSGDSAESSARAASVRVWVCLHGMATLRASLPWFPWPPRDALLDELVSRAADLRPPPRGGVSD